jgi:hypothetical protein
MVSKEYQTRNILELLGKRPNIMLLLFTQMSGSNIKTEVLKQRTSKESNAVNYSSVFTYVTLKELDGTIVS